MTPLATKPHGVVNKSQARIITPFGILKYWKSSKSNCLVYKQTGQFLFLKSSHQTERKYKACDLSCALLV
jgi:hypothetical protein